MVASFFVGLGPGGLKYVTASYPQVYLKYVCLPGSSHGGNVPPSLEGFGPLTPFLQVGDSYDKENLATFRGGSGGDAIRSMSFFLFL